MTINWVAFTPLTALAGGVLIGLSAVLYALANGRVAGIAGLIGNPLSAIIEGKLGQGEFVALSFLGGLLIAPWAWQLVASLPATTFTASWPKLIVAGLLVGIGVRMGNGCTSGHGVCGLSRLSLRSVVNVFAFMGAGMAAVVAVRAFS